MPDIDQQSCRDALTTLLKSVAILDTYTDILGVHTRNSVWRAVLDMMRHAILSLQIPPAQITKILHRTGFTNFHANPQGGITHVRKDSNKLHRGP